MVVVVVVGGAVVVGAAVVVLVDDVGGTESTLASSSPPHAAATSPMIASVATRALRRAVAVADTSKVYDRAPRATKCPHRAGRGLAWTTVDVVNRSMPGRPASWLVGLVLLVGCTTGSDVEATEDAGSALAATSTTSIAVPSTSEIAVTSTTAITLPSTTAVSAPDTAPAPTTAVPPPAPADNGEPVAATPAECAAEIDLEIRLGQLLFPVVLQPEIGRAIELAERGHIAGVVVLGAPSAEITAQLSELQARSLIGPSIVAVDEEGGRVQRLEALVGVKPSARAIASSLTAEEARSAAREHAEEIGALGFTMNLAPVLDLDTGPFIGSRSYGADPDVVERYGLAVADGVLDAGLTPAVKHFPGHGSAADSHLGLPRTAPLDELEASDLRPFAAAIDRGDLPVMVGHLVVPGLTGEVPASLSPEVVEGLLRRDLGFDGLVMTDAFNMAAISDGLDDIGAAEAAIAAGVDLAMLGDLSATTATLASLVAAVETGRLDESSVTESFLRVLDHKGLEVCDLPADLAPAIRCDGVSSGGCSLANG